MNIEKREMEHHSDILKKNETELATAFEVGETVLNSLPFLQEINEKHNNHQSINESEKKQLLNLRKTLKTYSKTFPNPLSTQCEKWPVLYMQDRIKLAIENNWYGRSDVYPFQNEFIQILQNEFRLPSMDKYPKDRDKLLELASVPDVYPGVRFLPGFRQLDWSNTSVNSNEILYKSNSSHNVIHLRKPDGRSYCLASVNSLYALEEAFRKSNIFFPVRNVQEVEDISFDPYVLFDNDGTLTTYIDSFEQPRQYEKFIKGIDALFEDLAADSIPFGLWTRNSPGTALAIAKNIEKSTMLKCYPGYDFGNWPGLDNQLPKDDPHKIKPLSVEEMDETIQNLSSPVADNLKTYAEQTFGISDPRMLSQKIHDFLTYYLTQKTEDGYHDLWIYALEAKVPLFAALFDPDLDEASRNRLLNGGVLVNDNILSLASVSEFGFNFIYVNDSERTHTAADVISQMRR